MDFSVFGFHALVEAGVAAEGYTVPTPIQVQAIPPVMQGRDIMGLAQTGTGKTAAFALPILHRLITGKKGAVRALVLAPTRELAEQTHQAIEALGKKTRLRSISVYGGVGIGTQVLKLKRGAEIVVACPGRLLDLLGRRQIDLSGVEVLVLDEADQMFDMGFLPDIRRILGHLPSRRQNLLFSATMPAEIRGLAKDVLVRPMVVQVGADAPASTVRHALYPVPPHLKTALLMEILRRSDSGPMLVFTRTKHRARKLGDQLARAGYRSASLQGNLSQSRRQAALAGFRSGAFQVLVATDIAARGIDVSRISHVINYDIPSTTEAYIHRIGRTGRAACTGDAFTFVTGEDKAMVSAIDRIIGARIERRLLDGFDYGIAAPPESDSKAAPGTRPAARSFRPRQPGVGTSKGVFAAFAPVKKKTFGSRGKGGEFPQGRPSDTFKRGRACSRAGH